MLQKVSVLLTFSSDGSYRVLRIADATAFGRP